MRRFSVFPLIIFLFFIFSCSKKVAFENTGFSSIGGSLEVINKTLSKNIPQKGYKYYDTLHSNDFRLFAFVWSNPEKKKFYVKTAEVFGKNPKVSVIKFMGDYYVKIINKTVTSCYGYSNKLPSFGFKEVKVDWNVFDRKGCDQGFKMKFSSKEDADKFASAVSFLLSQYEEEDDMDYYMPKKENEVQKKSLNTTNKCSVEKILKMKEIGLTVDEIKKVCE